LLFSLCAATSIVTVIASAPSALRQRGERQSVRRLASALNTFVASGFGIAFLLLKLMTPSETFVGILIVFGLIEIAIRQWKPSTTHPHS
jgi:hypothetical protein